MLHTSRRNASANQASTLASLPGLAAEVDIDGQAPLKGTLVDVGDGRVTIEVATASKAALLAAASAARLVVHAPGLRFEALAAPSRVAQGRSVAMVVAGTAGLRRRSA